MTWWDSAIAAIDSLLLEHAVLASFLYLAIEEAGVPIPVPADFLMITLGVRAREGTVSLWQVIVAMEAGTVVGSSLLYLLARRGGRNVVERYGRYIGIGPEQLERAEVRLKRHGFGAIVLGRLLPGLRVLTAIACGIFRVPFRVFFPAMSVGGLIYIVGYTMLGYLAGPSVLAVFEVLHLPVGLVVTAGPLLVLLAALVVIRRRLPHPLPRPNLSFRKTARIGLLAGGLASGGSLLMLNVLVIVLGDLAWRLPDSLPAEAADQLSLALSRDATGGVLWLGMPLIAGLGWGVLYANWAEPQLGGHDAVRGLAFSLLPLLVSAGLLSPLLTHVADVTRVVPVTVLTDLFRHACFGLILGLSYPVLRAR